MGITGTEVSKDAASMILQDDNFATIIKAVANGRNVYRNIKNAILFLLSGNMAGIFAVLFCSIMALPVPFEAVHLLFINLLTDSLPAIAIGMEKPEKICSDRNPVIRNRESLQKLFCSYARTGRFDCRCNAHFILHRTSDKPSRCKHNGICNTHACKTVPRL